MMRRLALLVLVLALGGCIGPKRQARAQAHFDLGSVYLSESNPEGAIVELRQSAKFDPRSWATWDKLGLAYMAKGAGAEAQDAFERGVKLAPDNAQILNNYGLLLLEQKKLGQAIEVFNHALEDLTYKKPALVLNNLGFALYLDGQYDLALQRLSEAVERLPSLCPARFHRGLVNQARGDLNAAIADLDAVIQTCKEGAPGAYYHAAEVLIAQGNLSAASVYLRTAEQMAGDDKALAEAARALREKEGL